MPIPITMPALSPTMTTGHLIVWHKKVNDAVNTGDLLLEIETVSQLWQFPIETSITGADLSERPDIAMIAIEPPGES